MAPCSIGGPLQIFHQLRPTRTTTLPVQPRRIPDVRPETHETTGADTLLDNLTVFEQLLYTSELKNPQRESLARKRERVEVVITQLAMEGCRDITIGTALKRGISGIPPPPSPSTPRNFPLILPLQLAAAHTGSLGRLPGRLPQLGGDFLRVPGPCSTSRRFGTTEASLGSWRVPGVFPPAAPRCCLLVIRPGG